MGIKDRFGISGKPEKLLSYFKLTPQDIAQEAKKLLNNKPRLLRAAN